MSRFLNQSDCYLFIKLESCITFPQNNDVDMLKCSTKVNKSKKHSPKLEPEQDNRICIMDLPLNFASINFSDFDKAVIFLCHIVK